MSWKIPRHKAAFVFRASVIFSFSFREPVSAHVCVYREAFLSGGSCAPFVGRLSALLWRTRNGNFEEEEEREREFINNEQVVV